MATVKLSVTIEEDVLAWLRQRASRLHGGNLSAAIAEAARVVQQREAMGELLAHLGAPKLADEEIEAIRAEWRGDPSPSRAARTKAKRVA